MFFPLPLSCVPKTATDYCLTVNIINKSTTRSRVCIFEQEWTMCHITAELWYRDAHIIPVLLDHLRVLKLEAQRNGTRRFVFLFTITNHCSTILSQLNLFHTLSPYFTKIHFNIIPSHPHVGLLTDSSSWSVHSSSPIACIMSHVIHPS
jgi:hypothetical protein